MAEPISLEQIKQHLDVVRDDQDGMLFDKGVSAREWVETYTGLSFDGDRTTQTFDSFARVGNLLAWPEGDEPEARIDYVDIAGEPQQITKARLWRVTKPARVMPPLGGAWPTDAVGPIAITVTGVPYSLKAAMLLIIGNLTGLRMSDEGAIVNLCHPFRLPVIG